MKRVAVLVASLSVLASADGQPLLASDFPLGGFEWPAQGKVSAASFLVLPEDALLRLYQGASLGTLPCGWVDGQAIIRPGTPLGPTLSRGAKVAWQGKTFLGNGIAVNRFFGANVVAAEVSLGQSWLDGGAAWILDYQRTSHVYGRYRDEIRMVSPGLYLGLMYDQTTCPPKLVRLFALECPAR